VTRSVGALRAARLLLRLRLRRLLNQIDSVMRYRMGSPERKAASRTSPIAWVLSGLVGLAMLGSATSLSHQVISSLEKTLGSVQVRADSPAPAGKGASVPGKRRPVLRPLPPEPGSVVPSGVLNGAVLEASLLLVAALLISLASREFARPEWDLEWLASLPLPLSTLVVCRLIERAVANAAGFLALAPFLSVFAWTCGYRWTAPLLGFALTLALLFLSATVQCLLDTGLRLTVAPARLRNLQAAISLVSTFPLFFAMAMGMPGGSFMFGWAAALPAFVAWLPPGLAVRALAAADAGTATQWAALMIGEIAVGVAVGLMVLQRQLRHGVVASGSREAVARVPRRAAHASAGFGLSSLTFLSAVQRRELQLLARDRNFMMQTLLLPVTIVGVQAFLLGSQVFAGAIEQPANLAAMAFGLSAYALMFSAFQTLNAEGQALWILYCVPQSLRSVLLQKAKFWAAITVVYPIGVFMVAIATAGHVSLQLAGAGVVVLIGVPIFALIATALGVFGCNPLAQDIQRKIRITYLYLYMLIASLYAYAFYADGMWQRLALIVLTALVAIALWQKARDQFDYLLDPSASPPARVSVSDGLIAALLFFVVQGLVGIIQLAASGSTTPTGAMLWISFCSAGVLTYAIMRLVYWRARTIDVPAAFGPGLPHALLPAVAGGVAAAMLALLYLQLVQAMNWFPSLRQASQFTDPALPWWLAALAIVAAPIFEEFIFRGLIFGGLRRMFGLGTATLASAAIFAIVHPAASVAPVFIMGVCAALVYERSRMLAAPIALHSVYNAIIFAAPSSALWSQ